MKAASTKSAPQNLTGTIQTARLQVAAAETRWKEAKEQARLAKRRRKEVKLIARRAKKLAKQAKADLAQARKALAEAEARLASAGARRVTRNPAKAKAKPVASRAVAARKQKAVPARNRQSRPSAPSPVSKSKAQVGRAPLQKSVSSLVTTPAESVIGKSNGGTSEPAVIAGAAAVAATQTQPIQGIQAGKPS
jgi:chromosome segregation ATPase